MAGIQMSGLASGMDTATIVAQLMGVERLPRARVERQQAAVQQRQDLLKELQTKLKALKNATSDLNAGSLWNPTRTATSDDVSRVGSRPTGSPVTAGVYDVVVTQAARKESEGYQFRQRPSATTLEITDSAGVPKTLTIAANATLDDVVNQINADSTLAVTARNDGAGNIWFDAKVAGSTGTFSLNDNSNGILGTAQTAVSALDWQFTVNGAAHTSTSNYNTTAISGVELDLKGLTTPGTPVKVTVAETPTDKAAVAAKLKTYVEAYNAVVDFTRGKLTEKGVANAATVTDAKKGVLFGDSGLTQVLNTLRNGLMDPLAGNPELQDEMHEIGLSTGSAVSAISPDRVQGKLTFDEAKFNKAWDTNQADVEKLLRGDGTTGGFTQRMDALIKPMVDVGGILDGRINAAGSQLKSFSDNLARIDKRLERKEEFYKRQFTQLETAMSAAQTMQSALAGQLAGLPSMSSK